MFDSLSSCIPNTTVTTSFTSDKNQVFDIWTNVAITVNGITSIQRPIYLNIGDTVEATVTSPTTFLNYNFYIYYLDGRQQTFAVVNKNNYLPTVRGSDSRKRWYNYIPNQFTISFYKDIGKHDFLLGYGKELIDIDDLHIVLDPQGKSVCFYTRTRLMICRVEMPDGPINYKKIPTDFVTDNYTQELLTLCADGRLYRIKFDTRYIYSDEFKPAVLPVIPLEDLPYLQDLPNGGSWTDVARAKFLRSLFPVVTALDYSDNLIWLAGSNTIYVCNRNFVLQDTITIGAEQILDLACLGSGAIIVTKNQRAYYVTRGGSSTLLYSAGALGSPCANYDNTKVFIPDCNNKRILVYQTGLTYQTWSTGDFIPAYARLFNGDLWVTGHDSNRVLKFDTSGNYGAIEFDLKTALVSVNGGHCIGIHCLQEFTTLENLGIELVIPYQNRDRRGPVNHIGSTPVQVKLLGQDLIYAKPGPLVTVWVNGKTDYPISTNDWISASFRAPGPGQYRCNYIIGDRAFDLNIEAISSVSVYDHYSTSTDPAHKATALYGYVNTFDNGDEDTGVTILDIGFPFTFFNNSYTTVSVTTNGYIRFGSNTDIEKKPLFGSLGYDAIYAEPQDLYQGLPLNNVDPINLTTGSLTSGRTPGIYFKSEIIGSFRSFRIRWVGTAMSAYPLGNTVPILTNIESTNELPVDNLEFTKNNDYVSGPGLTTSTQVVDKKTYNSRLIGFASEGDIIYLTTKDNNLKQYSNVLVNNTFVGFYLANSFSSITGTRILYTNGNVVGVDKTLPQLVLDDLEKYVYEFSGKTAIQPHTVTEINQDISHINNVDNDTDLIVSSADFAKIYQGHTVSNPYTGELQVDNKLINSIVVTITTNKLYLLSSETTIEFTISCPVPVTVNYGFSLLARDFDTHFAVSSDIDGIVESKSRIGQITAIPGATTKIILTNIILNNNIVKFVSASFSALDNFTVINFNIIVDSILPLYSSPIPNTDTEIMSYNELVVRLSSPFSVGAGNVFSFKHTALEFTTLPVFSASGNVFYNLNTIQLTNVVTPTISVPKIIELHGNFIQISNTITSSAYNEYTFKDTLPAPDYTYEVGIYTGKNLSYIELYYDNNNHSSTTEVGISAGNSLFKSSNITVPYNSSALFGSYAYNGNLISLGIGSFTANSLGFVAKELEFHRVASPREDIARYEAIVEQKFLPGSNIHLGINYGSVYLSNTDLDDRPVKENDIVAVQIPFGIHKSLIAPMISFGDHQIVIPAVADENLGIYPEIYTVQENVIKNQYITESITVTIAGEYMIPPYDRLLIDDDLDFIFLRTRSGITQRLFGINHNFLADDVITVQNILTSNRLWDTRTVYIVGPAVLRITLRTNPGPVFNFADFGTLDNPYTRYLTYFANTPVEYEENLVYKSTNITLTSSSALTGTLAVNTPGIEIYVDGVFQSNNFNVNVSTGNAIQMYWSVPNYFQSNVYVYQRKIDPFDNSIVFIPVGLWSVNNIPVINEPSLFGPTSVVSYKHTGDVTGAFNFFNKDLSGLNVVTQSTFKSNTIESKLNKNLSDKFSFKPSSQFLYSLEQTKGQIESGTVSATYINISQIQPNSENPNTEFTGRIYSDKLELGVELYSQSARADILQHNGVVIIGNIGSDYIKTSTTFLGTYSSDFLPGFTQLYFQSPITEADKVFTVITSESSRANLLPASDTYKSSTNSLYQYGPTGVFSDTGFSAEVIQRSLLEISQYTTNILEAGTTVGYQHTQDIIDNNNQIFHSFYSVHDESREVINYSIPALYYSSNVSIKSEMSATKVPAGTDLFVNFDKEFYHQQYVNSLMDSKIFVQNYINNEFISEYVRTNYIYTEIDSKIITQNILPYKFGGKLTVENPLELRIAADRVSNNFLSFQIQPQFAKNNPRVFSIQPQFIRVNELKFSLVPEFHRPSFFSKDIENLFQSENIITRGFDFELYKEKIWEMLDFTNYGAFDTFFETYADGGRGSDNLLNLGTPKNYGPYLRYTADQASSLIKGSVHGIYYIHAGNVLVHVNGTNWHYALDYSHSEIKVNSWVPGSGTVSGYTQIGPNDKNQRVVREDPWGQKNIIWEITGGSADGTEKQFGYDSNQFLINHLNSYRSTVFIKRTSTEANGNIYFGFTTNDNLYSLDNDALVTTDPYWDIRPVSSLNKDQWYLFAGYVYPSNLKERYPLDEMGIYDMDAKKVFSFNGTINAGVKFDANTLTMNQRIFHSITVEGNVKIEIAFPRVDAWDGQQPSIKRLTRFTEYQKWKTGQNYLGGNVIVFENNNTITFGSYTNAVTRVPGRTYGYGAYNDYTAAQAQAQRYVNAGAFNIVATDYWNYRIYFNYEKPAEYDIKVIDPILNREKVIADMGDLIEIEITSINSYENLGFRIEPYNAEIEYLIIGGGGGGGFGIGGGGGGGAVVYGNVEYDLEIPVHVVVGDGGYAGLTSTTGNIIPTDGKYTSFGNIVAPGGGRGGSSDGGTLINRYKIFQTPTTTYIVEGPWGILRAINVNLKLDPTDPFYGFTNKQTYTGPYRQQIVLNLPANTQVNGVRIEWKFSSELVSATIKGPGLPVNGLNVTSLSVNRTPPLFKNSAKAVGASFEYEYYVTNIQLASGATKFQSGFRILATAPVPLWGTKLDMVWSNTAPGTDKIFNKIFNVDLTGNYTIVNQSVSGQHGVFINNILQPQISQTHNSPGGVASTLPVTFNGLTEIRIAAFAPDANQEGMIFKILDSSKTVVFNLEDLLDPNVVVSNSEAVNGNVGSSGGGGGYDLLGNVFGTGGIGNVLYGFDGGAGNLSLGLGTAGGGGGAGQAGQVSFYRDATEFQANLKITIPTVHESNLIAFGGNGGIGKPVDDESCWIVGGGGGGGSMFYSNTLGIFHGNGGLYGGGDSATITNNIGAPGYFGGGGGGGKGNIVYPPPNTFGPSELFLDESPISTYATFQGTAWANVSQYWDNKDFAQIVWESANGSVIAARVHGVGGSRPDSYNVAQSAQGIFKLIIPNLPPHAGIRYTCKYFMAGDFNANIDSGPVDSNEIYIENDLFARFTKTGGENVDPPGPPVFSHSSFVTNTWFSKSGPVISPDQLLYYTNIEGVTWNLYDDGSGEPGRYDRVNGYIDFDSGIVPHTLSTLTIQHNMLFNGNTHSMAAFIGEVKVFIIYPPPPTVTYTSGGAGGNGMVILKYDNIYELKVDPTLLSETIQFGSRKMTLLYEGLGDLKFKLACFPETKTVCSPRKGPTFPVKWWIKGG